MKWRIKDSQGCWCDVEVDEGALPFMVRKAEGSPTGKCKSGPVTVRLRRPKRRYRVTCPGNAPSPGGSARGLKSVEVPAFSLKGAMRRGCSMLEKLYNDGYRVFHSDCTVEEVAS